jgi:hypothetical protein
MNLVIEIFCLVIFIESVTNIVSKSELFSPFRSFLLSKRKNKFIEFVHAVVECPYCLSVWVSLFSTLMFCLYKFDLLFDVLIWFMFVMVFHRLSNIMHFIIDRIKS